MKWFAAVLFSLFTIQPAHALFLDSFTGLEWELTPQAEGAVLPEDVPTGFRYATFPEGVTLLNHYVRNQDCDGFLGDRCTPSAVDNIRSFIVTLIGDPMALPSILAVFAPTIQPIGGDAAYLKLAIDRWDNVYADIQFSVPPPRDDVSMLLISESSPVPEPSTLALLSIGVLFFLWPGRRFA